LAPKSTIFAPLPKPPPVNGVPQWGTGTRGATRYQNDPIFRAQSQQALQYGRNLFAQQMGRTFVNPMGGPQTGGAPGGGGNPYSGLLNEFLNSSKARFAADSAADAASRDAALRRYIISYGQVPDFDKLGISKEARGFLEKALDAKTRELAENNTKEGTSVFARTQRANEVANRKIPAQLAARGMLRSGQTGYDLGEQAQNYKIQSFDQLNEMLGGVEGTVGNFLQAERARADALAQAELQAQMAAYSNYGGDMYGDPDPYTQPYMGGTGPVTNKGSVTTAWKPPKPSAPVYLGNKGGKKVLVKANSPFRRK